MKMILSFSIIPMLMSLFSCSGANYTDMDVNEFGLLLKEDKAALIDVRTEKEYAEGHLAGAVNVDFLSKSFVSKVEAAYPKDKPLAVYCRSGKRSSGAAKLLAGAGYTVYNLKGGYMAWTEAGKMVTKYEVEVFRTRSGSPVSIYLIKHGTLAIEYDGMLFHIDPVAEYGKHTDYGSEFPKADVILVTHEHPDHLDDAALKVLESDSTLLILNKTSADRIGRGEVIANGQKRELPKGVMLEAVPAYNTTAGREMFHPKGNGNGYVLTMDSLRIYIAGDTEDVPEMASLKDIDIAFLPVNQPYTMTVEQCVKAAGIIKPKVLIPYHFSKTDITSIPQLLPDIKVLLRQMQ